MYPNHHGNGPAPSVSALQTPVASFALLWVEVDGEPLWEPHLAKMNHF